MNKWRFGNYYHLQESIDDLKERILKLLAQNHKMTLSEIKNSLELPVGSYHGNPNDPVNQAIIALARERRITLPGQAWGEPLVALV